MIATFIQLLMVCFSFPKLCTETIPNLPDQQTLLHSEYHSGKITLVEST